MHDSIDSIFFKWSYKIESLTLLSPQKKGADTNETNKQHSFDHLIGLDILMFMRSFPNLLYYERIYGADDIHR